MFSLRRQFLPILLGIILLPHIAIAVNFTDVPQGVWYEHDLQIVESKGWVSGYKDSQGNALHLFGPEDLVTMGQALKVTQLAADRRVAIDGCVGCHWAEPYKNEAADDFIDLNMKDLNRFITRSEAVALLANAFRLDESHDANQKGVFGSTSGIQDSMCTYYSAFADVSKNL
jgi:hypothetical protein